MPIDGIINMKATKKQKKKNQPSESLFNHKQLQGIYFVQFKPIFSLILTSVYRIQSQLLDFVLKLKI